MIFPSKMDFSSYTVRKIRSMVEKIKKVFINHFQEGRQLICPDIGVITFKE